MNWHAMHLGIQYVCTVFSLVMYLTHYNRLLLSNPKQRITPFVKTMQNLIGKIFISAKNAPRMQKLFDI